MRYSASSSCRGMCVKAGEFVNGGEIYLPFLKQRERRGKECRSKSTTRVFSLYINHFNLKSVG